MDLLIVNADDLGLNAATTDAILECFMAGRITSTSAMMFMSDSERAAGLARAHELPVGLHLNLIEPFDGPSVPHEAGIRQKALAEYFGQGGLRRWTFSARHARLVRRVIADQLAEFSRLYGSTPTHVDGHRHLHQNLTVLFSPALAAGVKMRPSFTFRSGEKSWGNRYARGTLNRIMRLRYPGPDWLINVRTLHPSLAGGEWTLMPPPRSGTIEVMTHPGWADEFQFLMSDAWTDLMNGFPLGSYVDVDAAPAP